MSGDVTPWHVQDVKDGIPSLAGRQPPPPAGVPSLVPPAEPPATSVSTTPSTLTTVAAGMQPDVVDPLSRAMRAFDPDAAIPPNALGQIGAAALAQYYTPTYNHECEEFQQGWRTAGDIATAVQSCANTYISTEEATTAYVHETASQLLQLPYEAADQSELQAWGSGSPAPNTAAQPNGSANPPVMLGLVGELNAAAIDGPYLQTKLKNAGTALLEIANALHIPAGNLPEVGQSQWSTAIFDASSLVIAVTAREYAQATVSSISTGAMPGIQTALLRAWSGPAWDAAYPVIEKFGAAVTAAGSRAQAMLDILDTIISDYSSYLRKTVTTCAQYFSEIDQLQVKVHVHGSVGTNPSGSAAAFVRQVANDISMLSSGLTTTIAGVISPIRRSIEMNLSRVNAFTGAQWVSFPVITSANDLPAAHTTPPLHLGLRLSVY